MLQIVAQFENKRWLWEVVSQGHLYYWKSVKRFNNTLGRKQTITVEEVPSGMPLLICSDTDELLLAYNRPVSLAHLQMLIPQTDEVKILAMKIALNLPPVK